MNYDGLTMVACIDDSNNSLFVTNIIKQQLSKYIHRFPHHTRYFSDDIVYICIYLYDKHLYVYIKLKVVIGKRSFKGNQRG